MPVNYNQPSSYKFIYSHAPTSTDSVSTLPVIRGINKNHSYLSHNKCAPVNTAWRVQRLQMEERPPIWRVAANTLNKQLQTDNMGWYSSLGVRDVLTTPHRKKMPCYETSTIALGLYWSFGQSKKWKWEMRFGMSNVRSLYRLGSWQ